MPQTKVSAHQLQMNLGPNTPRRPPPLHGRMPPWPPVPARSEPERAEADEPAGAAGEVVRS